MERISQHFQCHGTGTKENRREEGAATVTSVDELMHTLYELPEHFNRHMKNREYRKAKRCRDNAIFLSTVMNVPDAVSMELFGNRPYIDPDYEEFKDGLFREEDSLRAEEECFKSLKQQVEEEEQNRQRLGPRIIYRDLMRKK